MATESQLTLTNSALGFAGGRTQIEDLAERSNEAQQAGLHFARTVRSVLALVPWDFATTTVAPAVVAPQGPIPPGWNYVYQRPADALVVQQMFDAGTGQAAGIPIFPGAIGQNFVAGGKTRFSTGWLGGLRVLYTNTAKPTVQYTRWTTDFDSWSPMAIELLIVTLAAKLAIPISGDKTLRDRLKQEQIEVEARARAIAANETVDVQDYPAEWMLVRELGEWAPGSEGTGGPFTVPAGFVDASLFGNLPTSPPAAAGLPWNDGGLLAITGP